MNFKILKGLIRWAGLNKGMAISHILAHQKAVSIVWRQIIKNLITIVTQLDGLKIDGPNDETWDGRVGPPISFV